MAAKKPSSKDTKAPAKKAAAPAAKKAPAAKPAAKKAAAPAEKKAPAKKAAGPITEAFNKTQLLNELAEKTGLTKKQVSGLMDELAEIMGRHVTKKGAGAFTMPGLFKVSVVRKPATKARKGINPFTKEETVFKAKPASNVVKIRPLKKLKDMAE